jgi:hypothetical protein
MFPIKKMVTLYMASDGELYPARRRKAEPLEARHVWDTSV